MYIALEGIKGAGKSTVFHALTAELTKQGLDFETFSPTRPMPSHIWWEQAYKKWSNDDQFLSDLYTARANYHAMHTDFSKDLILGDRSIVTSLATRWQENSQYGCGYVQQVRQREYAVPLPDTVLYLDIDVANARQRIEKRQRLYGKKDETVKRLIQVHQAYQEIFVKRNTLGLGSIEYLKVNANQEFSQVYQALFNCIEEKTVKLI